ncbi:MAG: hypothetical protein J5596_00330 [Bacteroidaceae bacterium]|nr:hypothetical protein [Bacteroidaceae bacterium]
MYKRFLLMFWALFPMLAMGQTNIQASWYVDGSKVKFENRSHTSLESMDQGASVIYATNGVELILTKLRMNKTSGAILDDDRRETGRNSALLADAGSQVLLEFCEVTSHASQANGVTASGKGTKITLQEGVMTTNRAASMAVNSIHGAEVIVKKTEVNTSGNQSAGIFALDSGLVVATEAFGLCGGQASPLFYVVSGKIQADKCRMSSAKWTIGSVDDGLLEVTGSELKAGGICGFLVYGADRDRKCRSYGVLNLKKNTITVSEGPLILLTNSFADITLTGNKISCKSDEIISVRRDEWGVKGLNQGDGHLYLEKQTLNGDIFVDSISSLSVFLKKGAKLNGAITGDPTDTREVKVVMHKGSSWTVKGDVYLTAVSFDGVSMEKGLKQIKGKHVIYYDADALINSSLGGKEYKTGGGVLRPMKK